jgi:hypothetical protein
MSQPPSMGAGAESPVDRLLARLRGVRASGSGWVAHWPAHDDRSPSLTVADGVDGRALVHCHAGCSTDSIVTAVGMSVVDLFSPGDPHRRRPRLWKGAIPIGPNGRPALTSFGDDRVAAMLAELGRLAHTRGTLDEGVGDSLVHLGLCCGTSATAIRLALEAALDTDRVRVGR